DVFGSQLRFEPAPHKNTLGFWTNEDDYAAWQFTVSKPGTFEVELLQGCGKGQGGSVVEIEVFDATGMLILPSLTHTVEDTGHFQSFVPRVIGTVNLEESGRYFFQVSAESKKAAAVMDLRQVTLRPMR